MKKILFFILVSSAFAQHVSTVNTGVFTNTQPNMYNQSQVGTTEPGGFFFTSQGGYMTDAFTGIVTAPVGATAHQFNGGNFTCLTAAVSSALGANENCVGVYAAGRNQANSTAAWGANFTMGDATGYTGTLAIGNEIDVGLAATSQPTRFQGVFVTGNSLSFSGGGAMAQGPIMGTLNVASNSSSGYGLALSGTAGNWQFPVAYWSSKGSAAVGLMLDANAYSGAAPSQSIQLGGNDGATAHTATINASSNGDLVLTPASGRTTQGNNIPIVAGLSTTASTSDTVSLSGMTASGHCSLTATNASAATNIATTYVSNKTSNQITVTHTATGSMTYDVMCTPN